LAIAAIWAPDQRLPAKYANFSKPRHATERLAPRCLLPVFCIRIVDDRCDGGSLMTVHYPRDMVGYGATPLEAR